MPISITHTHANRDRTQNNGFFIPTYGVFIVSGTTGEIQGSTTGSLTASLDTNCTRLRRIEVFHSGAATTFDFIIENKSPNVGASFDPTSIIASYNSIPGSVDFTGGIDQLEDLFGTINSDGNLYLKFMPAGTNGNVFKYLMFFESVFIYGP